MTKTTQDSQWWLARLHKHDMRIQRVESTRAGGRVLVLRYVDEDGHEYTGELMIRPDNTWTAETLTTSRSTP